MGGKECKVGLRIERKVGLLTPKTMPKHFLSTPKQLWKSPENDFFQPQIGQKRPLRTLKFRLKFSILGLINGPLELKINPKVGLLRPKRMTKDFLNYSQTTLKKSIIRLFRPPKWPKMTPHNSQNEQIFDCKFWFSRSFTDLPRWKCTQKLAF